MHNVLKGYICRDKVLHCQYISYYVQDIFLIDREKMDVVYYTNEKFLYSLLYKWLTCHPVKDTKSDNVNSVLCNLPE